MKPLHGDPNPMGEEVISQSQLGFLTTKLPAANEGPSSMGGLGLLRALTAQGEEQGQGQGQTDRLGGLVISESAPARTFQTEVDFGDHAEGLGALASASASQEQTAQRPSSVAALPKLVRATGPDARQRFPGGIGAGSPPQHPASPPEGFGDEHGGAGAGPGVGAVASRSIESTVDGSRDQQR